MIARAVVNPAAVKTLHLSGHAVAGAAAAELLITFALCDVVLNVATSKDQPGNGVVRAGHRVHRGGGCLRRRRISGGSFNPAVTLGAATGGLFAWSMIWVYVVVELGAGMAAGLAFLALNPGDR